MDYLLDNRVSFSTTESSLRNNMTGDFLHLPPSATFILLTLIKHHGNVVARNTFYDNAWNDFGFELSGNTLNQYVSLLRKHLSHLGMEGDIILTAPRAGFSLSESIKVKPSITFKPDSGHSSMHLKWLYLIPVILLIAEVIFLSLRGSAQLLYSPMSLGNIGVCQVFSSHNLASNYRADALRIANDLAKRYLPCRKGSIYIFDADRSLLYQQDGRSFLSRCDKSTVGNTLSGCQEVLMYETRNQDTNRS